MASLNRDNVLKVRAIYQDLLRDPRTSHLNHEQRTRLALRMLERPGELNLPAELKDLEAELEQKTKPAKGAENKDTPPTDEEDGWEGTGKLKLCKACSQANRGALRAHQPRSYIR